MPLKNDVKSRAQEIGFHAVGITGAEPFLDANPALRQTLPTAKTVISVALSYLTDPSDQADPSDTPRGQVARFSQGLDYHSVMHARLARLACMIPGETRAFCDTGPISDRDVAVRAGIGSRGKNTCVYVREYGSWVVLGELLTDLALEPDEPSDRDVCGECEICMKACPTGAICAPYTVDASRCLSQVTQMKAGIPIPLRARLGARIYGCDTCQSVCPLNKDAKSGNLEEFRPAPGLGESPELLPLLNITSREFEAKIAPTTAGWIRRTRFRRNVAVALGNLRDPAAIPELEKTLSDPDDVIREHAAWALAEIRRVTD